MKIYIAAKYARRFDLKAEADKLIEHGHEIVAQWLYNGEEEAAGPAEAGQMDVDDVLRADALVFVGEPHGSKNTGGGRWFELGLAYATGKPCVVLLAPAPEERSTHIGGAEPEHESVFTSMPYFVLCRTWSEVRKALKALPEGAEPPPHIYHGNPPRVPQKSDL